MLTSEEILRNEMLTKQETKELISNQMRQNLSELDNTEIYELRELLTYIKCSSQLIEGSHPDVKEFEHWSELSSDLDAMADRLSVYERRLHNNNIANLNIQ